MSSGLFGMSSGPCVSSSEIVIEDFGETRSAQGNGANDVQACGQHRFVNDYSDGGRLAARADDARTEHLDASVFLARHPYPPQNSSRPAAENTRGGDVEEDTHTYRNVTRTSRKVVKRFSELAVGCHNKVLMLMLRNETTRNSLQLAHFPR
ncbi:uncharacterized protein LOC135400875 isoform X2 [Ornithodoros turicata]|uniref:uncharacterized protein LOC135400875 isoform X2 n=1 Tax=Ornithodoros turicata TaxID=34597 RepID=UPI00313A1361